MACGRRNLPPLPPWCTGTPAQLLLRQAASAARRAGKCENVPEVFAQPRGAPSPAATSALLLWKSGGCTRVVPNMLVVVENLLTQTPIATGPGALSFGTAVLVSYFFPAGSTPKAMPTRSRMFLSSCILIIPERSIDRVGTGGVASAARTSR